MHSARSNVNIILIFKWKGILWNVTLIAFPGSSAAPVPSGTEARMEMGRHLVAVVGCYSRTATSFLVARQGEPIFFNPLWFTSYGVDVGLKNHQDDSSSNLK